MQERQYFPINEELAKMSHDMMSFSDYNSGSKTAEYRAEVDRVYGLAEEVAEKKPGLADRAWRLAGIFSKKLAENMNSASRIGTMCPSILIAGGSGMNVRKKERQISAMDRNMEQYRDVYKLVDELKSLLTRKESIKAGDDNAVELLQEKLDKLEGQRDSMKQINAWYRKNGSLKGCPGVSDEMAYKLDAKMERYKDRAPFPTWELTNLSAQIRSVKKRIENISFEKEKETTETAYDDLGVSVVENVECMRIQMVFEDKPEENVREYLKRNGFRWSPRNGAWQRNLNASGRDAVKWVLKYIKEEQEA